jgi:peptide/nickel transport system ATP-binding protein
MTEPVLAIEDLTIALPSGADRRHAVENLRLQLNPGEITCLVGESGSGKSMVAKAIMGLLPANVRITGGALRFGAADLAAMSAPAMRAIRGARIGMVFQEPMTALNPLHRVGRQVDEVLRLHTPLDRAARRARIRDMFTELHLPDPTQLFHAYPHQLSGGQRQRVVIAMALILEPRLLIADEPTTALDVTTQAQILKLLRALQRDRGTAVLFITHDFGVVADIADHVAVLQQGQLVEAGRRDTLLDRPRHPATIALLNAVPRLPSRSPGVREAGQAGAAPPILVAEHLTKSFRRRFRGGRPTAALDGVSLALQRGETLGIVGESGSGKSTLARALASLIKPDAGTITLDTQLVTNLSRRQLRPFRQRVQMVFQDPYASLDPRQRAGDIIAEGPLIHGARPAEAWARARQLLALVGLDPAAAQRYPHEFSGGQRQRIGIARALALDPRILIADEAVSALDVSVQAQILDLLAHIKKTLDLSMIFVTHDLRVALRVSDRIAVMQAGKIVELADAATIFAAPHHPYTRALFAAVPGIGRDHTEPVLL